MKLLQNLGAAKLGAITGITGGVLIALMLIIFQLATPPMSLLYSGLDYSEAGEIMQRLDQSGIEYRVEGNGTMIFAPKDQVLKLRMDLAQDGLPSGGTVGYELFDNTNALNTTSFVQDLNRLRALEGELSRTIRSLSVVNNARVHLVIPERALFAKDKREPTASIMLDARGTLNNQNVQAIRNLVASAVPDLTPQNVSVVDEAGNLLAAVTESGDQNMMAATLEDRTTAFEERMRKQVETIIASVVGPESVRVQVSAEIDFNRIVEQSETFDPDSQVARSTQTTEETSSNSEANPEGAVSVSNSLPETDQFAAANPQNESNNSRLQETVNYEISRTTKTETQEAGRVQRLSIAVVVDGTYTQAADGTESYTPRSEEEMTRITSLVRSAIGYNETRGDTLEVLNLRFAKEDAPVFEEEEEPLLGLGKDDYLRIAEILGAIIVAVILMLVLKSVLGRASAPAEGEAAPALPAAGDPNQAALPGAQQAGTDGAPLALPPGQTAPVGALPTEIASDIAPPAFKQSALSNLDVSQIEGKVKETSVNKIGELVNTHPEESVAILRNWLHES